MNPTHVLVVRAVLSVVFCVFYGYITLTILSREAEYASGVKDILTFLLGALTTAVVRVISFWFDSSQGSADKSAALARAVENRDAG